MRFRFPTIDWLLAFNVLFPYCVTAILSVVTTTDRHPMFWYLHAVIVTSLLVLVVVLSPCRKK